MFDWLFGSGEKDRQGLADRQAQSSDVYNQYNDWYGGLSDEARNSVNSQYGGDFMSHIKSETTDKSSQALSDYNKESCHDYFGNGLLGAILNPIGQTATAVGDLATGQYDDKGRDMWSDIGAAGQTALSVLPFAGGLARAGGMVGKLGSGIGKTVNSVPGMAATGAGFSAGETLRQDGSEAELGDLLGAAGTGAAFGAAIPIVGKVGGNMLRKRGSKVLNRELSQAGVADDAAQQFMSSVPNKALYQTALRSFVPKSTIGKAALGGGALYGASQLMGGLGGGQVDPTQQLAAQFEQMYGYPPSEYELQLLTAGGV